MTSPRSRRPLRRPWSLLTGAVRLLLDAGRPLLLGLLGLEVLSALGVILELLVVRNVLGGLLDSSHPVALDRLLPGLLLLVGVGAVLAVADAVHGGLQRVLGERVVRFAEGQVLEAATAVPLSAYDSTDFYDRLERARTGVQNRPYQLTADLTGALYALLGVLGVGTLLALLQPVLLVLVAVAALPLLLAAVVGGKRFYAASYEVTPAQREREYLREVLSSRGPAKDVRSLGLTRYLRGRYDRLYGDWVARVTRAERRRVLVLSGATLTSYAAIAAALVALAYLTRTGAISIAAAATAMAALAVLGQRLQQFARSAGSLYESGLFLADHRAFLDSAPSAAMPGGQPTPPFQRLELRAVRFAYPGQPTPVLDGVDLDVEVGQVVAIVGANGAGKTTLAKLICGLYPPDSGSITWNGQAVSELAEPGYRAALGVLFQDFTQFLLSARDNIGVGDTEAAGTPGSVEAAAIAAGADGFIGRLPLGYETLLGPEFAGGTDLSFGQWQRVALSRLFLRHAQLLVLDEPTAALDPDAERELFEEIRSSFRGRTTILVSHRFSTVRSADLIYVLEAGRVVERGSHTELMAMGGTYMRFYSGQASAYADPETPAT